MFGRFSFVALLTLILVGATSSSGAMAAGTSSPPRYTITDLGTLAGERSASIATSINTHGEVAGYASAIDGSNHAVVWDKKGKITDLRMLPGDLSTYGHSINERGQVAGSSPSPF